VAFRLPYGARNKCVFRLNYYLFRVDWLTNAAMRYVQCDHEVVRLCLLALQDQLLNGVILPDPFWSFVTC
jgi:hypothetical protein